ncbi:MAG: acyl-CoA dehydrogenase [Chitinophagales bacterium]|nr:MAG: acyl-CoA dehydrogenase [Chitinophagales bacterium]
MELPFHGIFTAYPAVAAAVIVAAILLIGYTGAPMWTLAAFIFLYGLGAPLWLLSIAAIVVVVFNIKPLRAQLVSRPLMNALKSAGFLPTISETERVALEAGTVWVDGEFFSGKPNFKKILKESYPDLTEEERAFLNGPTEELCRMTNDWQIFKEQDLPAEIWDFLKKERFFGMGIPKEYGGHGFSANAMNAVIAKIGTRSIPLCVDVMVPNSLGPAELLTHYGTKEQKEYYLPRLARGEEIPCFALTEPNAGSDAASISSYGEVFRGEDGKLYIRLNWNKRYITLAAVSTLLGLAFQLRDPENLLGKGTFPGITCALIPTNTPGVVLGRRHNPLGVPFINAPTEGHDVVVSVDQIIGGPAQAGNGWKMLMETLSGGRGIFLPAMGRGGSKMISLAGGAYAMVRQQFNTPIGKFEGIEEILGRIGGYTYILEALSRFTCGALDKGKKPAVISAIAKYNATEFNRIVVNDAMDMIGGAGIVLGPRNLIGHGYISLPIGITVEGSNIVTRSLIIFGQGLIRGHKYAVREMEAIMQNDVAGFDAAFWGHINMTVRNGFRSAMLSLTRGYLAGSPVSGPTAKYYRRLSWASATFAFMSDVALATLGGRLKMAEKLSGYFADALSWQYLAVCALRRFEAEGRKKEDLPFVKWACEQALYKIQDAFDKIFNNFPVPGLSAILGGPVALWSRINPLGVRPSDKLGHQIAEALLNPGPVRESLKEGVYLPKEPHEPLAQLEEAFRLVHESMDVYNKIRKAVKAKKLKKGRAKELLNDALEAKIINQAEYDLILKTEKLRNEVIRVDSFPLEEMPVNLPVVTAPPASRKQTAAT